MGPKNPLKLKINLQNIQSQMLHLSLNKFFPFHLLFSVSSLKFTTLEKKSSVFEQKQPSALVEETLECNEKCIFNFFINFFNNWCLTKTLQNSAQYARRSFLINIFHLFFSVFENLLLCLRFLSVYIRSTQEMTHLWMNNFLPFDLLNPTFIQKCIFGNGNWG